MNAMLIWSNGITINTIIFEDKDGKTGYERAVEQMYKEYDDHNYLDDADEELGAYKGNNFCRYSAEGEDFCFWRVERLPEEKTYLIPNTFSQSERCELFGLLIDTVEDFLEEKGINNDMIPNDERDSTDSTIIYGKDYDYLADRFSEILGISRGIPDNITAKEIADSLPEDILEAVYRKRELQYRIQDAKNHAEELGYEINDEDAKAIAERVIVDYDCNIPENVLIENIIEEYINDNSYER